MPDRGSAIISVSGMSFRGFLREDAPARMFSAHMALDRLPENSRTAIDIGAHIGLVSCALAQRGLQVHAFEPEPANYSFLVENIGANGFGRNVMAYNVGVAKESGWMTMRSAGANSGMTSPLYREECRELGPAYFVEINEALQIVDGQIDYLKIDVEGMEHQFISSITDANWDRVGLLDIETHLVDGVWRRIYRDDVMGFPVHDHLRERGFVPLPNTDNSVWRRAA